MKAWMLCGFVSLSFALTPDLSYGKERIDFSGAIEETHTESVKANRKLLEEVSQNETMAFYNADWLNLRKRKRHALASVEMKLRLRRAALKEEIK